MIKYFVSNKVNEKIELLEINGLKFVAILNDVHAHKHMYVFTKEKLIF